MKNIFLFVWMILSCFDSQAFKSPILTIIKGTANFLHEGDTVILHVNKYGNFNADKELNSTYTAIVKNSQYKFLISLAIPAYFTFIPTQRNTDLNLRSYLFEPGYNVSIECISQDSIEFSGKGAERLKVQFQNRKINMHWFRKINGWDTSQIKRTFSILDSCSIKQMEHLKANKKLLGEGVYTILYADILGESGLKIDNFLYYDFPAAVEMWRNVLFDYKDEFWEKYNAFDPNNKVLKYSNTYTNALIAKYKWDSCVINKRPFSIKACYEYFKNNFKGSLRERIITTLIYDNKSKTEEISYCLETALDYISNGDFSRLLQNIKNNLLIGSISYKFKLPDENGIFRDYSDFNGKVMLLDFWFTGCVGCLLVKPKIDSIVNLFKSQPVVVISISIDKDKETWLKSVQKNIYTSEHSINLYTEGKADLHPIISHYLIKAYPTLLLVDKNGKLCEHPINPRLDNGTNMVGLINRALGF